MKSTLCILVLGLATLPYKSFAQQRPVSNGIYFISNLQSNKVIDLPIQTLNTPGTPLQQWDPTGATNQQWRIVAVPNGGHEFVCGNTGWGYDGQYYIVNIASNEVLQFVDQGSGTRLEQGIYTGSTNQLWALGTVTNEPLRFYLLNEGTCDVAGVPENVIYNDGAPVEFVIGANPDTIRQWQFLPAQ